LEVANEIGRSQLVFAARRATIRKARLIRFQLELFGADAADLDGERQRKRPPKVMIADWARKGAERSVGVATTEVTARPDGFVRLPASEIQSVPFSSGRKLTMKQPLFLALAILAATGFVNGQVSKTSSVTQAKVESEVAEAIRQRLAALRRKDAAAYVTYFAEDSFVASDAGAMIKPESIAREWLRDNQSGIVYKGSSPLDLQVHAYGDIAVASFRLELDEDWGGQKLLGSSRYTDVFVRRGDRWLVVAHQETPIPNARRIAARVDPSVFDAYAGEYSLTPAYIVKVKREGDKLMDQWPGDSEYVEDVPVSETTFVARGEPGEIIYVKDKTGRVSHFILRTISGDLIANKIK
jgi:ketosteroid isomerase-like protein